MPEHEIAADVAPPARSARDQFDRQAAHYDKQWNAWSEESLTWLLDHADCRPDDIALDVATGTGFTALAFAPHLRAVIGLDVSPGMLAQARRQAEEQGLTNVTFQEGRAESLPFDDNTFDLITCRIAPHHFLSVPTFVSEAAHTLKPGGRFLLADTSVPDDRPELGDWQNQVETLRDPSHVRNYTPGQWRHFVEAASLRAEIVTDQGGGIPITLNDWMAKGGCVGAQAEIVREKFATAPAEAVQAFQIAALPDGDFGFTWQRTTLRARKS